MNNIIIRNVSEILNEINKLIENYQHTQKKIYSISDDFTGPSWYKYQHNLWFRGHSNVAWKITPQILRPDFDTIAHQSGSYLNDYEQTLYKQYKIRANFIIDQNLSGVDKYFEAQHHGLPTRLLDWTTNPLVALFFVVSAEVKNDGALYTMFSRSDFDNGKPEDVLYQNDTIVKEAIEAVFNGEKSKNKYNYPLRIIPNTRNGRLLNQSSRFTFHLDQHKELDSLVGICIYKYVIPKEYKNQITEELSMLNINLSTIFPDIDNVIKELKRDLRLNN